MKNFKNLTRKFLYGKIKDIGVVKGIGFIPNDEYYIDEHTYLFGFKLKTVRYWNKEDLENGVNPIKKKRIEVKGYIKEKEVK